VSDAELRDAFAVGWRVEAIEPATFAIAGAPGMPSSAHASLARMRRL
jgi:hypothetical protein